MKNKTVKKEDIVFEYFDEERDSEMMQNASAQDILKELGDMSEEEYNYYENLPNLE